MLYHFSVRKQVLRFSPNNSVSGRVNIFTPRISSRNFTFSNLNRQRSSLRHRPLAYFSLDKLSLFDPTGSQFIFTTRKRNLGQGNIFTGVCHSLCPQRGGLCMMSLPVWLPGPMFHLGGLCLVPCAFQGGLCLGGLCPCLGDRDPLPTRWRAGGTHLTGMHACWNRILTLIK